MGVTFERFTQLAQSTLFRSRDIIVNEQSTTARLGNIVFSSGNNPNKATMKAFREAMSRKFGVFGEHAFDTVLGHRQQMQKPLLFFINTFYLLSSSHLKRFVQKSNLCNSLIGQKIFIYSIYNLFYFGLNLLHVTRVFAVCTKSAQ